MAHRQGLLSVVALEDGVDGLGDHVRSVDVSLGEMAVAEAVGGWPAFEGGGANGEGGLGDWSSLSRDCPGVVREEGLGGWYRGARLRHPRPRGLMPALCKSVLRGAWGTEGQGRA